MAAATHKRDARLRLEDVVVAAAGAALSLQAESGSLPGGHNGPYHDPETPVRNTAHWTVTFLSAWELTGHLGFRAAAERAAHYLCLPDARPRGAAFHCRSRAGKDHTNGLIGQAWAIEALAEAGVRLGRPDLLRLGTEVFLMHPYESREGGWRRVTLEGEPASFDRTFNHQLWFCAAGALLVAAGQDGPARAVRDFVARLPEHLGLYPSGLIRHARGSFLAARARDRLAGAMRSLRNAWHARALHEKSVGYHAFNTYAFAMIERALPELGIAACPPVARALEYLSSSEYSESISANPYGFPYNPPGFECAVTLETFFPQMRVRVDAWIDRQFASTFNPATAQVDRNVADPATSAARLYEACRLL
jgi:hypothetical protein